MVLANCDVITTIDFSDALTQHQNSEADITVIYAKGLYNRDKSTNGCILQIDEDNTIKEVLTNPMMSGECNISLDMFIMNTDFLKQIVLEAISKNQKSLIRDVLQARKDEFVFKAYEHKGSFFKIDSLEAYYKANLALLDAKKRDSIFNREAPIYTKVGDNAPVKYGLESNVKNSLVADGCMIEGTVENCVLFRGVKIGKNAVIRNCVLMQGTEIADGCSIDSIVADKNVTISENRVLTGSSEYPLYLGKKQRSKKRVQHLFISILLAACFLEKHAKVCRNNSISHFCMSECVSFDRNRSGDSVHSENYVSEYAAAESRHDADCSIRNQGFLRQFFVERK